MMKKKIWCIAFCFVLAALLKTAVEYSVRQVNWWADCSITPISYGSEWYSEDGSLSFSTFEKFDDYEKTIAEGHIVTIAGGDVTKGFLTVGGKAIPVYIRVGVDGSFVLLLNDKPYLPSEIFETIEIWEGVDYEETDTNIIIIFEVEETTYFQEGQEIKLIYNKK